VARTALRDKSQVAIPHGVGAREEIATRLIADFQERSVSEPARSPVLPRASIYGGVAFAERAPSKKTARASTRMLARLVPWRSREISSPTARAFVAAKRI
jgi:hypothetical protein